MTAPLIVAVYEGFAWSFRATSERALQILHELAPVDGEHTYLNDGLLVEPRYASGFANALREAGASVEPPVCARCRKPPEVCARNYRRRVARWRRMSPAEQAKSLARLPSGYPKTCAERGR